MEEYNADFSPAKLDWILRIAASGKVQDFAHRLELKCAEISENKRLAFLESEQTTALNDPDFDLHLNQREHRQEFLKIFADNENTWQVHHDTSTIEAFLSHFPFLQNMVNEMIAAEKVQVIKRAIEGLERRKGESVSITHKTEAGRTKPTQEQLAAFYRTMLHLGAYPEFTANGRTMEENYKEIGARHINSPGKFKRYFRVAHPYKSMGELINALTFDVVESLIQTLPEKEKALDLLKIEKAKG